MKIKLSKSIEHGNLLAKKGDKFIKASRRTRNLAGVFMLESTIRGFTLNGERFHFDIPMGVRTQGEASIATKE